MTKPTGSLSGEALCVFDETARAQFAASYPETPHILKHSLRQHPLLELEALADLAEQLPEELIEYNFSDQPIGIDGKPDPTGIPIGETIRNIGQSGSWAALKNIERRPEYAALLADLLAELRSLIEARTGKMLHTQAFVFVSSPNAVTPYHFDPEHNILLQIRGSKVMTQFPAGDSTYAPDETHEAYHTGGPRELKWRDELQKGAKEFAIGPGDALFVPVMAPHYVRNGAEASISLSITWRSDWSFAEADARAFNQLLRKAGIVPKCPGRWPKRNRTKSIGWRALRKLGAVN
jgi:Cupin-like domain